MALKKPGDFFQTKEVVKIKEEIDQLVNPELSSISDAFDNYKDKVNKFQLLSDVIEDVQKELKDIKVEVYKKEELEETVIKSSLLLEKKVKQIKESVEKESKNVLNISSIKYKKLEEDVKKYHEKALTVIENKFGKIEEGQKSYNSKLAGIKSEIFRTEDLKKVTEKVKEDLAGFQKVDADISEKIKYMEEVFVKFNEQAVLNENVITEPPSTDNIDPLTPLDKKFVTFDQLSDHYRVFINRIQQQLSTLGGGGAVRIQDMDDIDLSTAQVNGKILEYDSTLKKWKGVTNAAGITTADVSTSTLNVVGVSTFNENVKFTGNNTNMRWNHDTSDLTLWNNTRLVFGDNEDFQIWHGGTHTFMKNMGGDLRIRGDVIKLAREDSSERYIECTKNQDVKLFFNGNEQFATTVDGVEIGSVGISTVGFITTTDLFVAGISTFSGDIQVGGDIQVADNIRHTGDTDTYIEFNADQIRLIAGGKGILRVTEASVDTVVINDGSNNCDFRVEGLNDEYLIFSDGGTDRVGIGTTNPTAKLDVEGTLNVGGTVNATGIATFRNGVNLLGLLHTNDDVNFTGENYNLSWDKSADALEFTDNAKATFGAGNDLEIYSNGTNGVIGGAVSFTADVTVGTSQAVGVVLTSPNGTKYRLVVANDGTLSTSAV